MLVIVLLDKRDKNDDQRTRPNRAHMDNAYTIIARIYLDLQERLSFARSPFGPRYLHYNEYDT